MEGTDVAEVPEEERTIGVLFYSKESSGDYYFSAEQCSIEAEINREIFNVLLSAVQAGRLPDWVNVTVRGLKYGSEPDGRGKIWDVNALGHAL